MYINLVYFRCCFVLTALFTVCIIWVHLRSFDKFYYEPGMAVKILHRGPLNRVSKAIAAEKIELINTSLIDMRYNLKEKLPEDAEETSNVESYPHSQERRSMKEGTNVDRKKSVGCKIPRLNPFHQLALNEIKNLEDIECPQNDIASVLDGMLVLDVQSINYLHLQYVRRPKEDDFHVELSDPVLFTKRRASPIGVGKIGCLLTYEDKVMQFENSDEVIVAKQCDTDAVFEITRDGRIKNLQGKCIGGNVSCKRNCLLMLLENCEDENTKFKFRPNGIIRHKSTGMCMQLDHDDVSGFSELLLSRACHKRSTRWWMNSFGKRDIRMKVPLAEDFVRLVAIKDGLLHTEYHANAVKKDSHVSGNRNKDNQYNIALVILESQSSLNMIRKMPKAYKYLKEDGKTMIFDGHTIVGDGTTDQLCAMLVGQLEENLPETKRDVPNSGFVDNWPFIFREFSKKGYATLFSEDDHTFAAFNYRLNGFKNPPADHYSRHFWQAVENEHQDYDRRCIGDKLYHQINLKYTESFYDAYKDRPKISVTVVSSIAHNSMNNIQYVDDDIVSFMEQLKTKGHLDKTFVFIVGDHGLRASNFRASFEGWLEERLPFFSITLPKNFIKQYPKYREVVKENTKTLTSHFDIYATLHHILNFPLEARKTIGQSLLTEIDRENRTCHSAGVKYQWCPCQVFEYVNSEGHEVHFMAKSVVKLMNRMNNQIPDGKLKCAQLELDKIISVAFNNVIAQQTTSNNNDNDDDEDDYVHTFKDNISSNRTSTGIYRITLRVEPSKGIYEAHVLYNRKSQQFRINPEISRLNFYGDQPSCIMKRHPQLRKFCFCI